MSLRRQPARTDSVWLHGSARQRVHPALRPAPRPPLFDPLVLGALAIALSAVYLFLFLAAISMGLDAATGWANLFLVGQWVFPGAMTQVCALLPAAASCDLMRVAWLDEGELTKPLHVLLAWGLFRLCFARRSLGWR